MANDVKPDDVIDGFIVGAPVHAGALSNVFWVEKAGLARPLIMKLPRLGADQPSESIIGFQTEATIVPTLKGPHVAPFVAVGDLAQTPYLVTEWIEGTSLEDKLSGGPLSPADVVSVGAAITDALHDLHQQGVIHLDLKPSNLILRADGTAVLIDFGFAHSAHYPDLLAEEIRFAAGSAPYVSPEQLLGRRDDRRSDLFALGVILYEAATGKLPFGEPDTDARNRFWLEPIPPSSLVPSLQPWLQEIILRCLEPRAELRYQTAAHVAFDLRHPDQIALTVRATKLKGAGLVPLASRFLRAHAEFGKRLRAPPTLHSATPIVLVAVDTMHLDDERQTAIRAAVTRILAQSAEFRLICLTAIPSSSSSFEHLVRLRHWSDALCVPAQRLSLHAIESGSPANVIVELARHNNADLIVLGAPQGGARAWAQSVASGVSAKASCSVYVVRLPRDAKL